MEWRKLNKEFYSLWPSVNLKVNSNVTNNLCIAKVLLLHGPPGVGKTSIVKSIAQCLNRPYGRISLGGEYDTSIMKGHRKTYIGAYPGNYLQLFR